MEGQKSKGGNYTEPRRPVIIAARIPQERVDIMARPVLAAVRKAFEDPAIAAEYELWKAKRDARIGQK